MSRRWERGSRLSRDSRPTFEGQAATGRRGGLGARTGNRRATAPVSLHDRGSPVRVPRPLGSHGRPFLSQTKAQHHEELTVLYEFFVRDAPGGVREVLEGGTFVEIGGLNGLEFTNTFLLEHELGWGGAMVEGCPSNFEKLRRNRPGVIAVGKSVCHPVPPSGTIAYSRKCGAQAGVAQAGLGDDLMQMYRGQEMAQHAVVEVPCDSMKSILLGAGISHIDLFVIDVEGYEQPLLESMDFSAISVHLVLIEVDHNAPPELARISSILEGAGFESRGMVAGNEIWINPFVPPKGTWVAHDDLPPWAPRHCAYPQCRLRDGIPMTPAERALWERRDRDGKATNFVPYLARLESASAMEAWRAGPGQVTE